MGTVSVRYIVDDVDAAVAFYRDQLGFAVQQYPAPGFASLTRDSLRLLLNRPGAGGAGQAGGDPRPGGWNRFQITVADLDAAVERLQASGAGFRSGIVAGRGGRQVLVVDPAGNPVELFEPPPD
jgi:predicted enzyme related to lactoylglutathione lyase